MKLFVYSLITIIATGILLTAIGTMTPLGLVRVIVAVFAVFVLVLVGLAATQKPKPQVFRPNMCFAIAEDDLSKGDIALVNVGTASLTLHAKAPSKEAGIQ